MSVLSLIRSAFGHASLYKALDASPSSTAEQLKRKYRLAALKYHPDRAITSYGATSSTLKFQAVSAAYQILMDRKKRSAYDSTGTILDECSEEDVSSPTPKYPRKNEHYHDHWESFFYYVFHEMIAPKVTNDLDANSYRGSSAERSDVIKYYKICKGNWEKVVECILGDKSDVERWARDIIDPAMLKGEVRDFSCMNDTKLLGKKKLIHPGDSSSDSDTEIVGTSTASRISSKRKQISLDDSSSDDDHQINMCKKKRLKKKVEQSTSASNKSHTLVAQASMSIRDKLDYRMAKKRKEKLAKEIELANLIQTKDWGTAASMNGNSTRRNNVGSLSNQLLDKMEKKYSTSSVKTKR
eukprot:scaffold19824_cov62-Cyclotella_meneghiniana.AAC.8